MQQSTTSGMASPQDMTRVSNPSDTSQPRALSFISVLVAVLRRQCLFLICILLHLILVMLHVALIVFRFDHPPKPIKDSVATQVFVLAVTILPTAIVRVRHLTVFYYEAIYLNGRPYTGVPCPRLTRYPKSCAKTQFSYHSIPHFPS